MLLTRAIGVAVLAGAGLLLTARPAQACTCTYGPIGVVRWPRDGATDVPIDTPIVIERYYLEGDLDDITYELSAEDGTVVALEEMRREDPAWEGCSEGQYLFLRPASPLVSGATYTLTIVEEADPQGEWGATFAVGEHAFEPEAAIDLEPLYLSVHGQTPCDSRGCRIGEVQVDLGSAPERPLWLVVKSGATEDGLNHWAFWPEYLYDGMSVPESAWTTELSFDLPPDDACIEIEMFGVEGRTLFHERRCEPDRCAIYDVIGYSTCGSPAFSPVEATRLSSGSCDDPPVLRSQPGVGVVYPGAGTATDAGVGYADAGTVTDAAVEVRRGTSPPVEDDVELSGRSTVEAKHPMNLEEDGCSVSAPGRAGASFQWLSAFALGLYVAGRARRRIG